MIKRCAAMLALLVWATPAPAVDCSASCDPTPLEVYSSNIQAKKLTVGIYNPTSQPVSGFIRGVVQSGGDEIYFYDAITAWPNSVTLYNRTFEHPIQVLSCLTVCNDPPDAPNEGPDPILLEFEELGTSGSGRPGGLP